MNFSLSQNGGSSSMIGAVPLALLLLAALLLIAALILTVHSVLLAERPYLSDKKARRGAAYRVIFEMTDPDGVTDDVSYERRLIRLERIRHWALRQDGRTRRAYLRAAGEIQQRARGTLVNRGRVRQMQEILRELPTPPREGAVSTSEGQR